MMPNILLQHTVFLDCWSFILLIRLVLVVSFC